MTYIRQSRWRCCPWTLSKPYRGSTRIYNLNSERRYPSPVDMFQTSSRGVFQLGIYVHLSPHIDYTTTTVHECKALTDPIEVLHHIRSLRAVKVHKAWVARSGQVAPTGHRTKLRYTLLLIRKRWHYLVKKNTRTVNGEGCGGLLHGWSSISIALVVGLQGRALSFWRPRRPCEDNGPFWINLSGTGDEGNFYF